jgi:N-acetylmuramoyl-L-alanine amidase
MTISGGFIATDLVAKAEIVTESPMPIPKIEYFDIEDCKAESEPVIEETPIEVYIPTEPEITMSEEDISLIALLTMAEAENQPEEGKRVVIDTVLNRMDSEHFPDTAHGVIYQPSHFSSMWNGRVNKVSATEECKQLVREELVSRRDSEVVYFTAGHYGKYGKPKYKLGDHYFSTYN